MIVCNLYYMPYIIIVDIERDTTRAAQRTQKMENKSGKYYEEVGDKLMTEGRIADAEKAYAHAMDDYSQDMGTPEGFDAYKRVLHKHIAALGDKETISAVMSALARRGKGISKPASKANAEKARAAVSPERRAEILAKARAAKAEKRNKQ